MPVCVCVCYLITLSGDAGIFPDWQSFKNIDHQQDFTADAGYVYSCAPNGLIIAITELYPGRRSSLALISLYVASVCGAGLVKNVSIFTKKICKASTSVTPRTSTAGAKVMIKTNSRKVPSLFLFLAGEILQIQIDLCCCFCSGS